MGDDLIIREGEPQKALSLILSGKVSVVRAGGEIAQLSGGTFIAEMCFLSGGPASADVCGQGRLEYIS